MLIKIRNFGPIKEFDFDLQKDLVAIFGKNNLGKSYAISVVYLIMKHFLYDMDVRGFFERGKKISVLKKDLQSGKKVDDIVIEEIISILKSSFQPTIKGIEKSFIVTYGELSEIQNKLSQEPLSILLCNDALDMTLNVKENSLNIESLKLKKEIVLKPAKKNLSLRETEGTITLYLTKDEDFVSENLERLINRFEQSFLREIYRVSQYIYYLPASRSGLYQALSVFLPIFAELSKNRNFFKSKVEIPTLSEPISDYFLKLSSMGRKSDKKDQSGKILQIAEEMEKLLGGEIVFDPKTKQILYKPYHSDLVLDIALTSSMVSELSPVVAYLKYIIADDHEIRLKGSSIRQSFIFIEEPEAHLHPEIQVKLMEIFARLTKVGVKVVMTSHSDYLFDKMNNLILDKTFDPSVVQAFVFKETETGSVAVNIPIDELGMDDENFLETAEQIFEEKMDLIEKLSED